MKNFLFRVLTKDKTQGYVGLITNINSQTDLFWSVDELGFNPYDVEFKETTFGGISLPVNIVIDDRDDTAGRYRCLLSSSRCEQQLGSQGNPTMAAGLLPLTASGY